MSIRRLYRDKKDGKILILTSMGLSGISGEFVDTLGTPYRAGLEYLDYMGCISKKRRNRIVLFIFRGLSLSYKRTRWESKVVEKSS